MKSKNGYRGKKSSKEQRENSDYNKTSQPELAMGEEEEEEDEEEENENEESKTAVDATCTEPESHTDVITP